MADDNGDGGGAWAQTPGQRKILHREEGDVQHGGHTRAAIYNYNLRYVDEDRLEKKLKEVIAQVCVQSGLGAPAWAARDVNDAGAGYACGVTIAIRVMRPVDATEVPRDLRDDWRVR